MRFELLTPTPDQLDALVADLSSWQQDGLPIQLHPGDLGWQWRFGSITLAEVLRVWTVDDTTMAIGFIDGGSLIRMAIAPSADHDEAFAQALVSDLEDPARGILDAPKLVVEARFGTAFRSLLHSRGWVDDDPWTPLVRDLSDPVDDTGLRVEVVGPERVDDRVAVQRAAFGRSTFTAVLWDGMSQSSAYQKGRCLVGYDGQDNAVAGVTVWSAGPGRPGLLEPMGVHRDHRGHGYGTAISVAAAAALRNMGASSALVVTPSSNEGAVATYASAGFRCMPEVTDFAYNS
ncbi:GNAT family N-acetyltransferase [Lapillicoccus sp.]|uniref:GNAT family N-acetyltransferase n=1 Tax=Lapillicoccus sp. TaxID=1909287 RepID=UPI003266DC00